MLPRRILMTADTIGGVWEYALDLSRALSASGIEVTLATMGREPTLGQRWDAERIPNLTLRTSTFKLEWMANAHDDMRDSGRWLLDMQDAVGPDLIHLNGFCHGALPGTAPVLMVAHSCVRSWWESVKGATAPAEWDHYTMSARQGLMAADAVVAPSRWMADAIERLYGVRPVHLIPNGRDATTGFSTEADKQPIIFAAGRLWDDAKNLRVLDRACARVSWPLYLAGSTHGPFDTAFVPTRGVALGTLPARELAVWMRSASIYALPAKYEPFGLSALEAALCGCALVLGDIPSLRENWEDAAVFVGPDDVDGLSTALERLIASPGERAELGRRAKLRARAFSIQRMTASYLAAYAHLLDAGRAEPRVAVSA